MTDRQRLGMTRKGYARFLKQCARPSEKRARGSYRAAARNAKRKRARPANRA